MGAWNNITRRRFLRGLGGATLALPFLPSLMGESFGQAMGPQRKRFIGVTFSNGAKKPQDSAGFFPEDMDLVNDGPNLHWKSLAQMGPQLSPVLSGHPFFDAPATRQKINILRGLDSVPGGYALGHDPGNIWSAYPTPADGSYHRTMDDILAGSSHVYSTEPAMRLLYCCIPLNQSIVVQSAGPGGAGNLPTPDPNALWDSLFSPQQLQDDQERARQVNRKRRILDAVNEDLRALMSSRRVSSTDRRRVQQHTDFLRDTIARLDAVRGQCTAPGRWDGTYQYPMNESMVPSLTDAFNHIVASAIMCGHTNVALYSLDNGGTDLRVFSFHPEGPFEQHHSLSHIPRYDASIRPILKVQQWYMTYGFASLCSLLDQAVEDPVNNRTYLDNSLVCTGNESGAEGDDHGRQSFPVVTAGSLGGAITTGKYYDFRDPARWPVEPDGSLERGDLATYVGVPYQWLHMTILRAFGFSFDEIEQAAGIAPGQGFGAWYNNYYNQYDDSPRRRTLPILAG